MVGKPDEPFVIFGRGLSDSCCDDGGGILVCPNQNHQTAADNHLPPFCTTGRLRHFDPFFYLGDLPARIAQLENVSTNRSAL